MTYLHPLDFEILAISIANILIYTLDNISLLISPFLREECTPFGGDQTNEMSKHNLKMEIKMEDEHH